MNGEQSRIAFPDWASRTLSQFSNNGPCNAAHSVLPQDELLLRTKAQWEKQQAVAAMCYWGYSEQNLMFGKNDWHRQNNNDRPITPISTQPLPSDHNGQIQIPRCTEQSSIKKDSRGLLNQRCDKKIARTAPSSFEASGKPFPCTECGKSFRQHSQLLTHQRTHTGDRPYLCSECPKAFRTQGTLAIHRRIHTGEKPYSCEECGRSFRTQGTLVIHRRTHSGDRPYKCQDCGKAFAARCSLVVHWRTHTGEKPYMCTECGKLFASRSDSARHTRTHKTGKKPYIRKIITQHPAL